MLSVGLRRRPSALQRMARTRRGGRHGDCACCSVGVLLPGSVAADVVFFGLHLAGKLPVLLNWTTGPANMAHAVKTLGIRHVITSKKLIDRLGIQIEGAEYLFLEDVRAGIGKLEAAMTLLSTYVLPGRLLHRLPRPEPSTPRRSSCSPPVPRARPRPCRSRTATC